MPHANPGGLDGATFDPLSDTPICPCALCAPLTERGTCVERGGPGFTIVPAASCTLDAPVCGGAQNLMVWQLHPGISEGRLTREQGAVMRLDPAVR